jgi:magnesium transporter
MSEPFPFQVCFEQPTTRRYFPRPYYPPPTRKAGILATSKKLPLFTELPSRGIRRLIFPKLPITDEPSLSKTRSRIGSNIIRCMIVDSAIYVNGRRAVEPSSLQETYEACRNQQGLAWIGLYDPTEEELSSVAEEFGLHPLAVEDAIKAHLRPKLERYGETLLVVLRPARYIDESETVEFGEIHVFVGPDFVVTVRHGRATTLDRVRRSLESMPELLRRGPEAILYAIMNQVVDDYAPVVAGLENDIDEIETEVFGGNAGVSRRIYELSREVIEFQRGTAPLEGMLSNLIEDGAEHVDPEVRRYLRHVQERAIRTIEQAAGFRELLNSILSVNLTLVGLQQNEEVKALYGAAIEQNEKVQALSEASINLNDQVKRISAWAAILVAPTLVGTIYGMNFEYMPELHWTLGYPFALVLMVAVSVALYVLFKRRGWL